MNIDGRFWFLTFADSRMRPTLSRIERQARQMGVFGEHICAWTEDDLDPDFRDRMKERLIFGTRGFGYWCWKPQIILQLLRQIPEGDVVLYADAGCHLNRKGLGRLCEYFDLAVQHGIVGFQSRSLGEGSRFDKRCHFLPERDWTKMDLLRYFGVSSNRDVLDSGQFAGGVMLFRNERNSLKFLREFLDVYYQRFDLCDDSPSRTQNLPGFRENRHDQSVFSLLAKLHGVYTLSIAEFVPVREFMPVDGNPTLWPSRWSELSNYPIWAKRDLGKFTRIVECPEWLKPLIGHTGRKLASKIYEAFRR